MLDAEIFARIKFKNIAIETHSQNTEKPREKSVIFEAIIKILDTLET